MEFEEVVRSRRMIRRFTAEPVEPELVDRILDLGLRAPSAGFSQGWDFVVLDEALAREDFWRATADRGRTQWLAGVRPAPVLIVCLSDEQTYRARYAEPDKSNSGQQWPVPYWDVDTGMAAMIMLLAAVDAGLGALFFGVPAERIPALRGALDIPANRSLVGVIALGHPASAAPSGSTRRRLRRDRSEVVHRNRFG